MELQPEVTQKQRAVMEENMHLCMGELPHVLQLASILQASFWNTLLRFIVIDGKQYPTNSKLRLGNDFFWAYTNPHQEDIRVSYDHEKGILFVEKMTMVSHPFLAGQRVSGELAQLCSLFGYERYGYTDPNRKIPQWDIAGKQISVREISSMKIESFWDRPKSIWMDNEDYTAFQIVIETQKKEASDE